MATKKYLSLERLTDYDALIKAKIDSDIENHTHSWNDLEDRPFGKDVAYVTYAEGEVSTDSEHTEGDGVFYGYLDNIFAIEVGKAYNVTIDGVLYENVECYAKNDYYGSPYLGASSGEEIKNNTSQYPFQVTFEGYYKTYMVYTKENAIHTVKVEESVQTEKTIEEKYIPDTIARTEYVDANFALKSDLQNIDLSALETKEDAQLKYDELVATKADKEHSHSWNDLTDRPFGSEIVNEPIEITWDGDKTDKIDIVEWSGFGNCYLGDYGITHYDQLLGGTVKIGENTYILDYYDSWGDIGYSIQSSEESYAKVVIITEQNEDYPIGVYAYYSPDTYVSYIKTNSFERETINKLDAKYLPENIQSDWNQNDETAIDYIRNRPFYETEAVEDVCVPETTASNFQEQDYMGDTYYTCNTPIDYYTSFSLDKAYTVIWDGVRYDNVICQNTMGGAMLGSSERQISGAYGEVNEYPFGIIMYDYGDRYELYIVAETSQTHTVKVFETIKEAELKTIDPKYLPETIARTEYVDANFALKSDLDNIDLSSLETKTDSQSKLDEAKAYADSAASTVKNDLLNGAGAAYDTLKELGELIVENKDAIDVLEDVATGKADAVHSHAISEVSGLQSALDGKADASHGTHVTFDSTNKPKMDGTSAFGTSTSVARADHVHPTDTSRASQTSLDNHIADSTKHITSTERTNWNAAKTHADSTHAPINAQANVIESIKVNGATQIITSKFVDITVPTDATDIGAAPATHGHAISDITDLQTTLNNAANAIQTNTNSINAHTDRISALETKVGDGFEEITSAEIQALFA